MSKLLYTLPPLSPDYSGVASVFHDTGALVVIHDASGCTGTYAGYDEPRWFGSDSPIFCSGLREMDAILGDDKKLLDKILAFTRDRQVPGIAIVGSPVPMIVGFDFQGFASLVESETGLPTFGFPANGLKLHDEGSSSAYLKIAERIVTKDGQRKPRGVNILGASALDCCDARTIDAMERLVGEASFDTISVWGSRSGFDDLKNAASARVNWVVSAAALPLARWMRASFGIPFVAGLPVGTREKDRIREAIVKMAENPDANARVYPAVDEKKEGVRILVTGEPLFAASLASAIIEECPDAGQVSLAGFFGTGVEDLIPGWHTFDSEKDASGWLGSESFDLIIGDPLFKGLMPKETRARFFPIPHTAVSGRLHSDSRARFFGPQALSEIKHLTGGTHEYR